MRRTDYHRFLLLALSLAIFAVAKGETVGPNGSQSRSNAVASKARGISCVFAQQERKIDDVSAVAAAVKSDARTKEPVLSVRGGHSEPRPPPLHDDGGKNHFTSAAESPQNEYPAHQASSNSDGRQHYPSHHGVSLPREAYLFPQGTWERYLRATNHDVAEARRRLTSTLQWRIQNGMEDILSKPHPHFDLFKQYYPHAYHLRGRNGEPVYYECPSKIDLPALKSAGLTLDHLLHHYALVTEFMWTYVSAHQEGPASKGITVIDLDGMRLRDFAGEAVTFLKRAASFTGAHYPERSGTIFVLNAPSFFQLIWRAVKPLVDPVTLAKVRVVGSDKNDPYEICNALMERIPIENIPREYGGRSNVPLGSAPEEEWLRELVQQNNWRAGQQQYQQRMQGTDKCYDRVYDGYN